LPRAADAAQALPVVTINDALARRHWPGADPLGQRLRLSGDPRWWTVVGVVGNIREFGLDTDVQPILYVPFDQLPTDTLTLVVRSKTAAREVVRGAREILSAIDPG